MKEVPCVLKSQLSEIQAAMSKHLAHFWNSLLEIQSSRTLFNNWNVIFSQTENVFEIKIFFKENFQKYNSCTQNSRI